MLTWLSGVINLESINVVSAFALLIVGYIVEKRFVSRITVFTNSLAINLFFLARNVPEIVVWYANIGLFVGIICLCMRILEEPMPSWFYETMKYTYSSIVVGLVMLYFTLLNPLTPVSIVTNSTIST
jgi:hypothetical protein